MIQNQRIREAIRPLNWVERALCRHHNPELWFQKKRKISRQAKLICYECPVMLECRVYSLSVRLDHSPEFLHGVWGGLTVNERQNRKEAQTKLDKALEMLWEKN